MSVIDWIDERLDLSEARRFIAEKGVPVHAQKIWYYLGGMTLFLFGVQILTGILLLLYYGRAPRKPTRACSSSLRRCRSGG